MNIVITGASRGIGKAIACKLASPQNQLALIARNATDLQDIINELHDIGCHAIAFSGDVTDEKKVAEIVAHVEEYFGHIDVLINNAGVGLFRELEEITVEEWDTVMDTNVKGTFLFCKSIVPMMKQRGKGHIISITSDVSRRTFATGALYCASKHAQDALLAALRKEVQPFGIKVSSILPGLTDTYFNDTEQGHEKKQDWLKAIDIAEAVVYVMNAPEYVVIDEIMLHPVVQQY